MKQRLQQQWPGLVMLGIILTVSSCLFFACNRAPLPEREADVVANPPKVDKPPHIKASACVACHQSIVEAWKPSQHANANRPVHPVLDAKPFEKAHTIVLGSTTSVIQRVGDEFQFVTKGLDGKQTTFKAASVIGVEPLIQYNLEFPKGRLQTFSIAHDPRSNEWFDIFQAEDRGHHEWGFWGNRGMSWNAQCAYCHMTGLVKGYDPETDAYHTTWDEHGISCVQCHWDMNDHVKAAKDTPNYLRAQEKDPARSMEVCATCHSRREELTLLYKVGDSYFDHYRLSGPDAPGLYYADGQILEEDYVFGSFLTSAMGQKGVTCMDCHDPHTTKLLAPVENNLLCLTCHLPPGNRGAKPIDALAHSFHPEGSTGNRCVECHMPKTTYMVRDPRRDHGFTIPDPLLTKELGIPNACNRCHEDQSVDWAVEWVDTWYGDRMERHTRRRARLVARAHEGDATVVPELLAMAQAEENDAWRAALTTLAANWASQPAVQDYLRFSLNHKHPMVRSAAVRGLAPYEATHSLLYPFLTDPVRLVRIDAAWALMGRLDKSLSAYKEIENYLKQTSDQPIGAMKQAQLALAENRLSDAEMWIARAAEWDPLTAYLKHVQGMILNRSGKNEEAAKAFQKAMALEPKNAEHPYTLSLLYGEMGRSDLVVEMLKQTVTVDPGFSRAWYNLGLAHASLNQLEESIQALRQAEKLEPNSPDFPYARATVHARKGERQEAVAAASRALQINPRYEAAMHLLQTLAAPQN